MLTINSLSGGRSSSYMAAHYPADYDVFALVLINDVSVTPNDKWLVKEVSNRLDVDFIGTAEDDLTLYAMLDLEQYVGRKITWVSGIDFGSLIDKRKALPNQFKRFCTTEMKMRPIFDWWFENVSEKSEMRIGIRWDEQERADNVRNDFKGIVGKRGTRNKWQVVNWREAKFPMVDDKVHHLMTYRWAESSGITFPEDSNCVGCFWKHEQQLRKNWDTNPAKMEWFATQEGKRTFKEGITYNQIKNIGLQLDFEFGGSAENCKSGWCGS